MEKRAKRLQNWSSYEEKKIIYVYKNFAQRTGNRTGSHYDVLFYFSLKCSIALFLLDRKVFAPEKKN